MPEQEMTPPESSLIQDHDAVMLARDTIELDPILKAEEKHGPVFRRELFDVAYAAYSSLTDGAPEERDTDRDGTKSRHLRRKVTLSDIHGVQRSVRILAEGDKIERNGKTYITKRIWMYNCIQSLGDLYGMGAVGGLYSYDFGLAQDEVKKCNCFSWEEVGEQGCQWTKEWEKAEIACRLMKFLEEHVNKTMVYVDKIVCFGLGCFRMDCEQAAQRSYIQHLAACSIRDLLAQKQGGIIPKIYTQEPMYCSADISYVTENFDMTVINDPEGFRILDGHSFVLSIAPNVPVRQIALGITHEFGGLAGFFCDEIYSEGLECNGKSEREVNDDATISLYETCEPSPALWKYKTENVWTEFSDKTANDWFGNMGVYVKRSSGG